MKGRSTDIQTIDQEWLDEKESWKLLLLKYWITAIFTAFGKEEKVLRAPFANAMQLLL